MCPRYARTQDRRPRPHPTGVRGHRSHLPAATATHNDDYAINCSPEHPARYLRSNTLLTDHRPQHMQRWPVAVHAIDFGAIYSYFTGFMGLYSPLKRLAAGHAAAPDRAPGSSAMRRPAGPRFNVQKHKSRKPLPPNQGPWRLTHTGQGHLRPYSRLRAKVSLLRRQMQRFAKGLGLQLGLKHCAFGQQFVGVEVRHRPSQCRAQQQHGHQL